MCLSWDVQVCTVAVGVVGDLCRALEKQLTPFCAPIIEIFLQNLRNQEVHRSIKPHIIACFGDIAFQIAGEFERFLHHTMTILGQAAMTTTNYNAEDEELREHIANLREAILDAYTGIVQGLSVDRKQQLLVQPAYLQPVIHLLIAISSDLHSEEGVIKRSIGLVGDLGSNLGDKVASAIGVGVGWIQNLYKNIDHYSDETKKVAAYTRQVCSHYSSSFLTLGPASGQSSDLVIALLMVCSSRVNQLIRASCLRVCQILERMPR